MEKARKLPRQDGSVWALRWRHEAAYESKNTKHNIDQRISRTDTPFNPYYYASSIARRGENEAQLESLETRGTKLTR